MCPIIFALRALLKIEKIELLGCLKVNDGSILGVKIHEGERVNELKQMIKAKNTKFKCFACQDFIAGDCQNIQGMLSK